MLKRVELQNKVNLCGDEYDVVLDDGSDFDTAFQTLKYAFGETEKNERIIVGLDNNVCKTIFKRDGQRNIYFYSDNKETEPKRKEFLESVLSKNPRSNIHIFICSTEDITLFYANKICSDILGEENLDSQISIIVNTKEDTNSVRIVIGA